MAINIQINNKINIRDILNRFEYLNKYLNKYSFKIFNILLNIQSSFLDVLDIRMDICFISEYSKRIFTDIF